MISTEILYGAVGNLMAMPFFPSEPLVKMAVLNELPQIVQTDAQLLWLIRRVTQLYNAWPGTSEIRAVYCSKYRPLDGIEVYSSVYPDGIPSERQAGEPAWPALPPGRVTADLEFDRKLQAVAKVKQFPGGKLKAK